jgi:hypothetical protein
MRKRKGGPLKVLAQPRGGGLCNCSAVNMLAAGAAGAGVEKGKGMRHNEAALHAVAQQQRHTTKKEQAVSALRAAAGQQHFVVAKAKQERVAVAPGPFTLLHAPARAQHCLRRLALCPLCITARGEMWGAEAAGAARRLWTRWRV